MRKVLIEVAVLALGATPVLAADISPGLWEITMETRVAATPGFTPAPFKLTQCLTAEDARDPSRLLGQLSTPGATGCSYTNKSYSGNTFSFAMQCAGDFALQSRGQVSYTSNSMEGSIAGTANVGGSVVETQNKVSARRLGGC